MVASNALRKQRTAQQLLYRQAELNVFRVRAVKERAMPLEPEASLNQETLDKLQKLTRANIDSSEGFRVAAEEMPVGEIAVLFRRLAEERLQTADELKTYINWNGEESVDDGSLAASVHRAWIKVRSLLSAGDAFTIVTEVERGENQIKRAYEEVLRETAGSAMDLVLLRQYATVKASHEQICDLRDVTRERK